MCSLLVPVLSCLALFPGHLTVLIIWQQGSLKLVSPLAKRCVYVLWKWTGMRGVSNVYLKLRYRKL